MPASTAKATTTAPAAIPEITIPEEVAAASLSAAEQLKRSGQQEVALETGVGTVYAFLLDSNSSAPLKVGKGEVALPKKLLENLPPGAVMTGLGVKPEGKGLPPWERGSDVAGQILLMPTMDITIFDGNLAKVAVAGQDPPLLVKLPGSSASSARCQYLDTSGPGAPQWSTVGLRRATAEEVNALLGPRSFTEGDVWCFSEHLSLFGALLDILLGCTNIDMISKEGLKAIVENEGWYMANSALIVFAIAFALFCALLAGTAWELYSLRLGRTFQAVGKIRLGRGLLACGPKLLKHKYAAVLVYAHDIFQCLRQGKGKLRYSSLAAGVQRFLALRTGICNACVAQHCWNGGGWIESKASIPKTALCKKLEFHSGLAEEVMQTDMNGVGPGHILRRFFMTVLSMHPLLDAMRVGAGSLTAKKRTTLQFCGIIGVLATNALVFNFSGATQSWEADAECPISPTSQLFIIVASIMSIIVNVIPNTFLGDLAKQVYGRPCWNAFWWFITLAYGGATSLFVVTALANLNPKDQNKWYSALRFSMSIKLIVMPMIQALRNCILLETFLFEDRRSDPSKQFHTVMGLRHAKEADLTAFEKKEMEVMATQSVSTEELVKFYALLGSKVMLEYEPLESTTDQVLMQAIKPLCKKPALSTFPIDVEVREVRGLHLNGARKSESELHCTVLHLGKASKNERPCISDQRSGASKVSLQLGGDDAACSWFFRTVIFGLEPDGALGFSVCSKDEDLGIAWLSAEEVLRVGAWAGELPVYPLDPGQGTFGMPPQGGLVPSLEFSGSRGQVAKKQLATLSVRIVLPKGYKEALGLHEIQKLRLELPEDPSEVVDPSKSLQQSLIEHYNMNERNCNAPPERRFEGQSDEDGADMAFGRSMSYCETYLKSIPPDRMVVHSRRGTFLHLVASVLSDAMDRLDCQEELRSKLMSRDFRDVLEMLKESEAHEIRYWIDIFALDLRKLSNGTHENDSWHEDHLSGLPTILRSLRKASCTQMVEEIKSKAKKLSRAGPLKQLLVVDRKFHFMHEKTGLSELMLAKAMKVRQRLILHPDDLHDATLQDELKRLASELQEAFKAHELPWTTPFLEDREAVYQAIKELVIAGIREHKKDHDPVWKDMDLSDIAAVAGAVQAGRAFEERAAGDVGEIGIDGMGLDIDA